MNYDEDTSNDSSSCGEQLEVAELLGEQIELPQGLAESPEIFQEFLNLVTWQNLNPSDQAHLMKCLPTFPENDAYEKQVTLRRLFNRENFKFGSPLTNFHEQLQRGYFRPDIAHLRRLMKKSERRQYRERNKRYTFDLLKEVIVGRREVLEAAYSSPPGPLKLQRQYFSNNPAGDPMQQKVKKRYFQELAAVRSEVGEYSQSSEDEVYTDRAPRGLSKKQRQKLNLLEASLASSDMSLVTSTLATKPSGFDLETHVTASSNPYEITEESFKKMLSAHRKRRFSQEKHPNLNTLGLTFRDVASRSQFVIQKKPNVSKVHSRRSSSASPLEKIKKKPSSASSTSVQKNKVEPNTLEFIESFTSEMKKELEDEAARKSEESADEEVQRVLDEMVEKKLKFETTCATTIPQQILPPTEVPIPTVPAVSVLPEPETKAEDEDLHYSQTSELVQDTHVCFFSLVRDIICSSPNHRMRLDKVEMKLRAWETNPISPLNEWFSLVDESWSNLLDSALCFLSGDYPAELQPEDFVPYIEFKPTLRSYQWIGAGRDSDSHLLALCSHWLDHKEEMTAPTTTNDLDLEDIDMEEVEEEGDTVGDDVVPPPRCPTSWTVYSCSVEEKLAFQEQERQRFANPTRAFTYRMHNYESVVGPVKGIYNSQTASSVLKPRGHNLLAANRPSYVTVLALVRDAAARLPNGEGTRADMCTLIRDSQYLDLTGSAETTLQSVVSGALDRLHYEVDACVRFDTKRKLWVYLHRGRSEAEMEKMHQQCQGLSKTVKKAPRKKSAKKADAGPIVLKEKEATEKVKKTKSMVRAVYKQKEETQREVVNKEVEESLVKVATSRVSENIQPTATIDAPLQQQEIVTASGKKILIQTTLAGSRAPVKFVTTAASTKLLSGGITKTTEPVQATLLKSHNIGGDGQHSLVKPSTVQSPFIVKNLTAGAQFLTASGQKVQILASGSQNLGQIQSIQLSNGQNILTQSLGSTATGGAASSLLQNIQQVQILTSTGQIITKTLPTASTTANLARTDGQMAEDGKGSILKTNTSAAATATLRCTPGQLAKAAATNVRLVTSQGSIMSHSAMTIADGKPAMSLLTSSQARQVLDKDQDGKPKLTAVVQQKAGAKLGAQVINVSGMQLLNKPHIAKNNASVLTGVKLVSTQQGVKMVATSSTTVVQTAIPQQKATTTMSKTLQMAGQIQGTQTVGKVQRASPHIINVEALVQNARANPANKQGSASLIQLPSSSSGIPQFAVVSQGNIISVAGQTRIIQAQPFSNVTSVAQAQRTMGGGGVIGQQNKPTLSNVRLGTNVTFAGMKPVILAKAQSQSQNVILTSDGTASGQALVLSSQGTVRGATPGTVTVMQPGGGQQILLPTSFPTGTINLKSLQGLQGLKVIPIASGSGQKVYARFVKTPQPQLEVPKADDKQ